MPANAIAAATLMLAMIAATVGTICQQESPPSAPCRDAECAGATAGMASGPGGWDAFLQRTLDRTERGLLHMAGIDVP